MSKSVVWLTLCALLAGAPAGAQRETAPPEPEAAELIERIVELQHEIDELKARLSPQDLEQLRSRLAEAATKPTPAEPAVAVASPTPTAPIAAAEAAPAVPTPTAPPPAEKVAALPPAEVPGPLPLLNRRPKRQACNTLHLLDENADGKISSQDRYWRHLYLWTDKNRDRQIQEREIESAYDRGVREIALSLETFIRTKGGLGEMRIEDHIVLDLRGDGFSDRARRDDGVLLVDATAIGRGDGLQLWGPASEALEGFQPFRPDLRFLDAGGTATALNCP